MTLKTGLGVVQGLENVAIRYTIYDFLLVSHSKYTSILHHLHVI